jgi:integrase
MGPLEVSRLSTTGTYAVGGVAGLQLQIIGAAKSWILRAVVGGKRRRMGLGSYPTVSLSRAREKAREAQELIDQGIDPIAERVRAHSSLRAQQARGIKFDAACKAYLEARSEEWRNLKHRQQWENTLATYASPVMGALLVEDIEKEHVLAVLRPIWKTKTETATRVRGRIEAVLDWATANGHRDGLNPARWKGHLSELLPRPNKLTKVEHHPALPISQLGSFMASLRQRDGISTRALEFAILTAARSGEVRGATWDEFDLEAALWTVPASRMKAGKEHRVPLSPQAMALLAALPRAKDSILVFPAPRAGMLSDMSLTAVTRRMDVSAVPHGFRSSFRDWAAERTTYPSDMAEMALAHAISNKVEAAYRRGDMFERRRQMMCDWAEFLDKS